MGALEACRRCGIVRILTSGGAADAISGAALIRRLVQKAEGLLIAAGGGVSEDNVARLVQETGVQEVHGSLRASLPSAMVSRPAHPIYMGAEKINTPEVEFTHKVTSGARVVALVAELKRTAEI